MKCKNPLCLLHLRFEEFFCNFCKVSLHSIYIIPINTQEFWVLYTLNVVMSPAHVFFAVLRSYFDIILLINQKLGVVDYTVFNSKILKYVCFKFVFFFLLKVCLRINNCKIFLSHNKHWYSFCLEIKTIGEIAFLVYPWVLCHYLWSQSWSYPTKKIFAANFLKKTKFLKCSLVYVMTYFKS